MSLGYQLRGPKAIWLYGEVTSWDKIVRTGFSFLNPCKFCGIFYEIHLFKLISIISPYVMEANDEK